VCVLLILLNTIIKGTETVQATPLRRTLIFSLIRMRYLPSVLRHCWLGGRKGIQPVKKIRGMVEVGTGYSGWSGAQPDGQCVGLCKSPLAA